MSAGLRERILAQLAEHHVMSLATQGDSGPWASSVFYAADGLDLYFLSPPQSRHGINIGDSAWIAASVNRDYDDWPEIRGLQLEGRATMLGGTDETRARAIYAARFPIAGLAGKAPAAIIKALAKVRWYRLRPAAIHLIDNRKGFGARETLQVEENSGL